MKTKKQTGKKVLSVFLAVLMLMSAWVFVAPSEAEASGVDNATQVAATNTAALNSIGSFNTNVTTIHGKFESDSDYLDAQYYDAIYKNVLYTDGAVTISASATSAKTEYGSSWTGSNGVTIYWYHPTATVMYDGSTTPSLGIAVNTVMYYTGTWSRKTVNRLSWVSSGGNGFTLNQNWRGSDGRLNFNYMWHGQSETMGYTSTVTNDGMKQTLSGNSDNHFYANLLKFTASMSDTEFYRTAKPTFSFYGDNGDKGKTISATTGDTLAVINYKPLKAALNEALGTGTYSISTLKSNASKYTTASIAEYVAAVKDLIAAKPNNYVNASTNNYTGYASAASAAITRFNNAKANLKLATYTVTFDDSLFDFSKFTIGGNLTVNERTDTGFTVTSTATDGNTGFSYEMPVESGKTYILSADFAFDNTKGGGGYDIYVHTLDANKQGETTATPDTSNGAHREGNVYISLTGQTANKRQYIRFTAGSNTKYIKIRFDANNTGNKLTVDNIRVYKEGKSVDDVSNIASVTKDYGTTYTLPTPTRTGYTFNGWVDANDNAANTITITDDISVYSTWTENKYNIVFDKNGGNGQTLGIDNILYTETKKLTKNGFLREGYTFMGWKDDAGTSYADEATVSKLSPTDGATVTLYAQWVKSPIITWENWNEDVLKTEYIPYGSIPSYTGDTPVREADEENHYVFKGWSDSFEATTTNKTFTAVFEAEVHDLTEIAYSDSGTHTLTCSDENCDYCIWVPHSEGRKEWTESGSFKATCTEKGQDAYNVYCKECNGRYDIEYIELDLIDHTPGEMVKENEVAATCTQNGSYEEVYYCTVCEEEIERTTVTVNATGHAYGDATAEVDPTCTETGMASYKQCSVCNLYFAAAEGALSTNGAESTDAFVINSLGHDWSDYTSEGNGVEDKHTRYCQRGCGEVETEVHDWVIKEEISKADCLNAGEAVYKCTKCDAERTDIAPAKGHAFVDTAEDPADCTESGMEAYRYCTECKLYFAADAETNSTEGKADTSSFVIAMLPHSYTGIAKDNEDGTHSFLCVNGCEKFGGATEHVWDEGVVTLKPDCFEKGTKRYTCTAEGCGAERVEEIPATGHVRVRHVAAVDVTEVCLSKGNVEHWICLDCRNIYTDAEFENKLENTTDFDGNGIPDELERTGPDHDFSGEYVPISGGVNGMHRQKCTNYENCKKFATAEKHNYDDGVTYKATCTEAGRTTFTCEDCGESYSIVNEKIPHATAKVEAKAPTCQKTGNNAYYQCSACNNCFKDEAATIATTAEKEKLHKVDHTWDGRNEFDEECEDPACKVREADCQNKALYKKHCKYCGEELIGADPYEYGKVSTEHKFENGAIVSDNNGQHATKCTVEGCTATTEYVACEYTTTTDIASTCKTFGYTIETCKICRHQKRTDKTELDSENHEGDTEVRDATDATCKKDGYTGDTYCLGCDEKTVTGKVIVADPKVHPHEDMQTVEGVDSTCQTEGHSTSRKCSVCGTVEENYITIPMKDHVWSDWEKVDGEDKHSRYCVTCIDDAKNGLVVATEKDACSGGTATCLAAAKCSTCGAEYGTKDASNHASTETILVGKADATCQVKGYTGDEYYTCCYNAEAEDNSKALKSRGTDIKTIDHKWSDWKKVDGEDKHSRYCVTCIDDAKNGLVVATEKDACSGGTAYCDRRAICSVCINPYGAVDAAKHSSTDTTVVGEIAATCTSKGYTGNVVYTCCNAVKSTGEETDELEHSCNIEVVNLRVPSTCKTQGTATYKCANCDATEEKSLALNPANHDGEVIVIEAVAATCQTAGKTAYKQCSGCNANITNPADVAATAHAWSAWTQIEEDGVKKHTRTCTTCQDTEDLDIATETVVCSGGTATCLAAAKCSTCGAEYGTVNAANHASTETILVGKVDATCQKNGYSGDTYYTCCYNAEAEDNTKALKSEGKVTTVDHYFSIVVRETLATCKTKGSIKYKCSTCVESEGVTAAEKTVEIARNPSRHEGMATVVVGAVAATCKEGGYTGDKYYNCCNALAMKGYETQPSDKHNYGTAIPEYLFAGVEEVKDDEGNVVSYKIKAKTDDLTYADMIGFRHADNNWYHKQVCADCGKVAESTCYTYEHTSTCTTTDICEVCAGLCSLVNLKNHTQKLTLIEAVASTCNQQGTIAYYVCNACDKSFFDEAGQRVVENADALKAPVTVEHTFDPAAAATPNADGTHVRKCTVCEKDITEACSGGIAYCNKKAECKVCGAEHGEKDASNHASDEVVTKNEIAATCDKPGYSGDVYYACCDVLKAKGNETPVDPTLHVKKLADNKDGTHSEICEGCSQVFSTADHEWVAGEIPGNVSCTEGYNLTYTCECGLTKTEWIEEAGHDYVATVKTTEATCTKNGSKVTTKTCTVCGNTVTDTETIKATGHDERRMNGVAATCTAAGSTDYIYCYRCDTVLQESTVIPARGCIDSDRNGFCDSCYSKVEVVIEPSECSCMCHSQSGITKIFYKIALFFWKLFKTNKTCCNGTVHY